MPSCYTILVGCRHFGVGSDLSAIASARALHPEVKPSILDLTFYLSNPSKLEIFKKKSIG